MANGNDICHQKFFFFAVDFFYNQLLKYVNFYAKQLIVLAISLLMVDSLSAHLW